MEATVNQFPINHLGLESLLRKAADFGVDFGTGNKAERLRYLVKLGLIAHPLRVKNPNHTARRGEPPRVIGMYPAETLARLVAIDRLVKSGRKLKFLTASEVDEQALRLAAISPALKEGYQEKEYQGYQEYQEYQGLEKEGQEAQETQESQAQNTGYQPPKWTPPVALWTKIGLSDAEIEKRLVAFSGQIEDRLQKLEDQLTVIPGSSSVIPASSSVIPASSSVIPAFSSVIPDSSSVILGTTFSYHERGTPESKTVDSGQARMTTGSQVSISESDLASLAKYTSSAPTRGVVGPEPRGLENQADILEREAKFFPPYPTKKIVTLATLSTIVAFMLLASINIKNIGLQEALAEKKRIITIEWPEKIFSLKKILAKKTIDIFFEHGKEKNLRTIKIAR